MRAAAESSFFTATERHHTSPYACHSPESALSESGGSRSRCKASHAVNGPAVPRRKRLSPRTPQSSAPVDQCQVHHELLRPQPGWRSQRHDGSPPRPLCLGRVKCRGRGHRDHVAGRLLRSSGAERMARPKTKSPWRRHDHTHACCRTLSLTLQHTRVCCRVKDTTIASARLGERRAEVAAPRRAAIRICASAAAAATTLRCRDASVSRSPATAAAVGATLARHS
eukprot:SAG11_NODE_11397_length_763_cov_1.320783_1_plen_224_part_10